jgi:hypothetical protein
MSQLHDLRVAAINRHRERLFGSSSLKAYSTTPEDGETEEHEFETDWRGSRIDDDGNWQFEIVATADWAETQAFLKKVSVLTVGGRRWKAKKVKEPIGESLVWKLQAISQ